MFFVVLDLDNKVGLVANQLRVEAEDGSQRAFNLRLRVVAGLQPAH